MQGISDQFGVLISLIFIEVGGEGGNILYILYHLFPPSPLTPKGKKTHINNLQICPALSAKC